MFTNRDKSYGNVNPNIPFQYGEYQESPSLPRLCYLVAELIHRWQKLAMQCLRMRGSTSASPQQTMRFIPDQTKAEIMTGPHREVSISARIVTSSITHGSKA